MVIQQEVAYGIVNSIADLRKGDGLEDFTVVVDGNQVRCHRFILAACSHFFRGLFRSGMKESIKNSVTLNDVSHSTFTHILTALYTGVDVLTEENVISIAHAADFLLIEFLVKECEKFVFRNNVSLQNYENVYRLAKIRDTKTVLCEVHKFMLKNFDVFWKSQLLLELSFHELLSLLKSDDLVVASEDEVVETILKWVSFGPSTVNTEGSSDETSQMGNEEAVSGTNDEEDSDVKAHKKDVTPSIILEQNKPQETREKHLFDLLSESRLCLTSSDCQGMLLKHPMIRNNNIESRDLVADAVCYRMQKGRRHWQWPAAAIHRRQSDLENVMLWNGQKTKVYSFADSKHYEIAASPEPKSYVTWFDNIPYLVNRKKLFVYKENVWTDLLKGPGYEPIALPCENFIYFFNKTSGKGHKFNPREWPLKLKPTPKFPGRKPMTSVSVFREKILVFNAENEDGEELTGVHCFDTRTETWRKLDDIKGPAENLISVHIDKNTYLLQTNGDMWTVTSSETKAVEINRCKKIWDFELDLCCAVYCNDTLYISCVIKGDLVDKPKSIPGIVNNVKYVCFTTTEMSFAPVILPKKYFHPPK